MMRDVDFAYVIERWKRTWFKALEGVYYVLLASAPS